LSVSVIEKLRRLERIRFFEEVFQNENVEFEIGLGGLFSLADR
jgi:hypothetical protein